MLGLGEVGLDRGDACERCVHLPFDRSEDGADVQGPCARSVSADVGREGVREGHDLKPHTLVGKLKSQGSRAGASMKVSAPMREDGVAWTVGLRNAGGGLGFEEARGMHRAREAVARYFAPSHTWTVQGDVAKPSTTFFRTSARLPSCGASPLDEHDLACAREALSRGPLSTQPTLRGGGRSGESLRQRSGQKR